MKIFTQVIASWMGGVNADWGKGGSRVEAGAFLCKLMKRGVAKTWFSGLCCKEFFFIIYFT